MPVQGVRTNNTPRQDAGWMDNLFLKLTWVNFACALLTLCLPSLFRQVRRRVMTHIASRNLGCGTVPVYPHRDPFLATDYYFQRNQALKEGRCFELDQSMFKEMGKTFRKCELGTTAITTMDAQNITAVLATSFDYFQVDPNRLLIAEPFLGYGIFTLDGEPWKHARNLVNCVFAKKQITDLNALRLYYDQFLDSIPADGSTVDLQPLFKRLYVNYASEFLFGIPVESLFPEDGMTQIDEFASLFNNCLRIMGKRLRLGNFRFLRGRDSEWTETIAQFHVLVKGLIHRAVKERDTRAKAREQGSYVLVDELLEETNDPEQIYSPLLNVYLPARDSIAIGISNIIFFLARRPIAWEKLRADVLAHSRRGHIKHEQLKSMQYLQDVIKEGLRLKAPAGRSIRAAKVDCVLPSGGGPKGDEPIFVPKGTRVDLNFHCMHHDPDIWGPDADEFRPERWEGRRPGWNYIPFLGGGRTCPAREMVLTHCGYILARLARDFAVLECRDPEPRFVEEIRKTMESRNGCKVAFLREPKVSRTDDLTST